MSFFESSEDLPSHPRHHDLIFLEGFPRADWQKLLNIAEFNKFSAGNVVVAEGDRDAAFYILTAGSVEVAKRTPTGEARLAIMREGTVFGEVAFFDGEPRSATVRARQDASVIKVTRHAFEIFAAWEPVLARRILHELGRALALRLRWAERQLDR